MRLSLPLEKRITVARKEDKKEEERLDMGMTLIDLVGELEEIH